MNGRRLVGAALDRTYAHPRLRVLLREAWGIGRTAAARSGMPYVLEPPEFEDLRRLRSASQGAAARTADAPRVLFLSMRGWSTHLMYETVLAHAVRRRGSEPVFATCGGRLPICDIVPGEAAPPMPCHSCRQYATGALTAGGFDALELRDVVDVGLETALARKRIAHLSTVAQCEAFEHDGLATTCSIPRATLFDRRAPMPHKRVIVRRLVPARRPPLAVSRAVPSWLSGCTCCLSGMRVPPSVVGHASCRVT